MDVGVQFACRIIQIYPGLYPYIAMTICTRSKNVILVHPTLCSVLCHCSLLHESSELEDIVFGDRLHIARVPGKLYYYPIYDYHRLNHYSYSGNLQNTICQKTT